MLSAEITPASVSPYTLVITKTVENLTMQGFVPGKFDLVSISAAASRAAPGLKVVNKLQIAHGNPAGFTEFAIYGISMLGELTVGKIDLVGSEIAISGDAETFDAFDRVSNGDARKRPAGMKLLATDIQPPVAEPYDWNAAVSGKTVALSGFVPNEASRDAIKSKIESTMPAVEISDNMRTARGAPANFSEITSFALDLLPKLMNGKVAMAGGEFQVEGIAIGTDAYDSLQKALAILPAGLKIATQKIEPVGVSPYTWSASLNGGQLKLDGYVRNEVAREAVLGLARNYFSNENVIDNMKIAAGESDTFDAAVKFSLSTLRHLENGRIFMSDSNLQIEGDAPDFDGHEMVITALANQVPDGITVQKSAISPPSVSSYQLNAEKKGFVITVTGHMPSSQARAAVIAAAKKANPGVEIIDQTKIASGVPVGIDWVVSANGVLALFNDLEMGSVAIKNDSFAIEGRARSKPAYDRGKELVKAPKFGGLNLQSEDIRLPVLSPYLWALKKSSDGIAISGYAENVDMEKANLEIVQQILGDGTKITNKQKTANGTPEHFSEAISVAAKIAGSLELAEITLTGKNMFVRGEALTGLAANRARSAIKDDLPEGYEGGHEITVRKIKVENLVKADKCQTLLSGILTNNQILFETSKSVIKSASFSLLDRLVYVTQQCPKTKVEIGGHTDSDGSDNYNQRLSENRANAIIAYLTRSGVFSSRLTANGFGEKQPIADNETDEGKQKNRRIEFKILDLEG